MKNGTGVAECLIVDRIIHSSQQSISFFLTGNGEREDKGASKILAFFFLFA